MTANDQHASHSMFSAMKMDLVIYLLLVVLTAFTVVSSFFGLGKIVSIVLALGIASMKAVLIALYYMHLMEERPLIWAIIAAGLATVAILGLGILPDVALKL